MPATGRPGAVGYPGSPGNRCIGPGAAARVIGSRIPTGLRAVLSAAPRGRRARAGDVDPPTDLLFPRPGGPMLAIAGSCGGAGTTRLAYLVASAAGRSPAPVLLADLGGPAATLAVYAGAASRTSLPGLAAEVARDGRAAGRVFAVGPRGTRLIATAPAVDETLDEAALAKVLGDARTAHALTVLDCGTLTRPAEQVAVREATHVAFVVPATPAAVARAGSRLRAAATGSAQTIIVARNIPGQRSVVPLAALANLADTHRASLVLMPAGGDPMTYAPEVLIDEAALTLQAVGALLLRGA